MDVVCRAMGECGEAGEQPGSGGHRDGTYRGGPRRNGHAGADWSSVTMHVTLERVFDLDEQSLPHLQSGDNNLYPGDLPPTALTHSLSALGFRRARPSVGRETVGSALNRKSVFLPFRRGVHFPSAFQGARR